MIEILLQGGDVIIAESSLDEMATMMSDAKKRKIMLNVFDTYSKQRYLFFAEAVTYIKERKE